MTHQEIHQGYIKHAAMAQIHRWYQIYENPDSAIENQIDILVADIKLKSGLGEATGHDAYRQRIAQLPKTWKNAHFIKDATVQIRPDGLIDLNLGLVYLNHGMKQDGSIRSANLTYATTLIPTGSVLPQFTKVEITQLDEGTVPEFKVAYPENRMLSLMHYWLALIEDPARRLEPFKEVLADGFELQFSSVKVTNFAEFEKWLRPPLRLPLARTPSIISPAKQSAPTPMT
jgi:hypothetical protein